MSTTHPSTIAALFTDPAQAEEALQRLRTAGFRPEDVGVAVRDARAREALQAGTDAVDTADSTAAGAVSGAFGGGLLGAVVGFLLGVGALVIPGIGPVVAGGALAAALGVAGATAVTGAGIGAAAGGLIGALMGMGIPEEEAQYFERGFIAGGVLITVRAGSRAIEAREILARSGADLGPAHAGDDTSGPHASTPREVSGRPVPVADSTVENRPDAAGDMGVAEPAGGAVAGAAAGALAGTVIAGPVGTVVGGAIGAIGGGAAGKAIHDSHDRETDEENADLDKPVGGDSSVRRG